MFPSKIINYEIIYREEIEKILGSEQINVYCSISGNVLRLRYVVAVVSTNIHLTDLLAGLVSNGGPHSMKPKWEYCCNTKMQLADQMLVRHGKWETCLLTSYQCLNCCTYRGWIIREVAPKQWSEPIRIMAKQMRELRSNMITCLMYKETRPVTHTSAGTKKMSRNTL